MSDLRPYVQQLMNFPLSRSGDRAPRINVDVDVLVCSLDCRVELVWRSINISRTGMLVECRGTPVRRFQYGTELLLIVSPDSHYLQEPLKVIAEIIRDASVGDRLRFGFKFLRAP